MSKSNGKQRVILASPTKGSVLRVLKKFKDNRFLWLYLGKNLSNSITIEHQIISKGEKLTTGKRLQEIAKELRQPYINYIGKLSIENNSLRWWLSSVSEKNPFISTVFLHICYNRLVLEYLKKSEEPQNFVFFIEDRALRRSLLKNISYKVELIESDISRIKEDFKEIIWMLLMKGWFIANTIYRVLISKYIFKEEKIFNTDVGSLNKPFILIHTWIDSRSFGSDRKFRDSYFGDLVNHLSTRDKNVGVVPSVLGTISYVRALKAMGQSKVRFLLPFSFISIYTILSVAIETTIDFPNKKQFLKFNGLDISDLIYEDLKRDWIGKRVASNLLLYYIVKGWKKKGIEIDSFIYTYENHTWEKVFCIALREFYPRTKIIGYQHSTLSKMLMNYFYSKNESGIIPLPDRIITNGRYPEKILKKSGYDPKKVVNGGAIRYKKVLKESKIDVEKQVSNKNQNYTILVTTSIDRTEAAELIWKVLIAFEGSKKYEIIIKYHPVLPYYKFAKVLGNISIPKNFKFSQKPITELLMESRVLLYTSSTTCIESLALGVPVSHV
jgi:hypothetical protein